MRTHLLVAVLALAGTACVAPGASPPDDDATGGLQPPTFAPLTESASPQAAPSPAASPSASTPGPTGTATVGGSPSGTPQPSPTPAASTPAPTATASPPPPAATVRGTLPDGTDDLDGLNRSQAPGYADLRAATLEMGSDRGAIRIEFASAAPEQGSDDEILNVATYHDVTGDGSVDYEIWASLTADGWGTSWYDLRAGTVRFAAEDEVDVAVDAGVLELTFPVTHLDGARSGQWLASTEWTTALMRTTGATVTDDAPDDRSGRRWPD